MTRRAKLLALPIAVVASAIEVSVTVQFELNSGRLALVTLFMTLVALLSAKREQRVQALPEWVSEGSLESAPDFEPPAEPHKLGASK
jgi:hypothetical protein